MNDIYNELRNIKNKNKNEILDRSLYFLSRKSGTSNNLEELAKEIRIDIAIIEKNFSNMSEVIDCIINRASAVSNEALLGIGNSPLKPTRKMEVLTDTILKGVKKKKVLAEEFAFMMKLGIEYEFNKKIQNYMNVPTYCVSEIIKEGQEVGEMIEGDSLNLAKTYWTFIQSICLNYIGFESDYMIPEGKVICRFLLK